MSSRLFVQADKYLPDSMLRSIGALRVYAARMQFYLGIPNTLMIGVLFYNDAPLLQAYIPTVYHWVAVILLVVVPLGVGVDRFLFHPAQIAYNQHQTSRENRNPTYRKVVAVEDKVDELHERLDD